jgi:hypothetical protein
MTNIDYTTDRYGRQFAGYPSPGRVFSYPATPAAASKSLNGAALAAVLMAIIGVAAAIAAFFYQADSSPVPPASIVTPGSVAHPATPRVPGVVSPVIVEAPPAGVATPWTVQPGDQTTTIINQPPPSDNPQTSPPVSVNVSPDYPAHTMPLDCAIPGANCGDQTSSDSDGSTSSGDMAQLPDNSDPDIMPGSVGGTPLPKGGLNPHSDQVHLPNGGEATVSDPGEATVSDPGKATLPDPGKATLPDPGKGGSAGGSTQKVCNPLVQVCGGG